MIRQLNQRVRVPIKEDDVETPKGIHWLTTAPNPASRATGYDAGRRGWKLHAIEADKSTKLVDIKDRRSLCGIRPAHGWGVDLFIEHVCDRCHAQMVKRIHAVVRKGGGA